MTWADFLASISRSGPAALALLALWAAEWWLPYYPQFLGQPGARLLHDGRNVVLGLINRFLLGLVFAAAFLWVDHWAAGQGFGFTRWCGLGGWWASLVALILFDGWMYAWHRANHELPWLWRWHCVHHTDQNMNASTGVRFHTGEIAFSNFARLLVLPLLGMSLAQLAMYEFLALPVVMLHHSNLRLPRWLDYGLLAFVVTPAMHRVHHSQDRADADSNYGVVLPVWDGLFRTLRLRKDNRQLTLGVRGLTASRFQTVPGMLATPFVHSSPPENEKQSIDAPAP